LISGPFSSGLGPSGRPSPAQTTHVLFFEGKWNYLLLLWDEELMHHTFFFSFNSHDMSAEHFSVFFSFYFSIAPPFLTPNILFPSNTLLVSHIMKTNTKQISRKIAERPVLSGYVLCPLLMNGERRIELYFSFLDFL